MIRPRPGQRALVLCALVLGLMAVTANGAQAEAGAKWLILNASKTQKTFLLATTQIKEILVNPSHHNEKVLVLTTKIGGTEVKFVATGMELINTVLETEGLLTTGFQARFTGVSTQFTLLIKSAPCLPLGTSGNDTTLDVITTHKLKGELVLHTGGEGVVKILPETGIVLGLLFFGEECALPEEVPIITKSGGTGLVIKDPTGFGKLNVNHELAEHVELTELWAISVIPEHKATITGIAVATLTGVHSGLEWNGTPG
jgi:hypothetical protein